MASKVHVWNNTFANLTLKKQIRDKKYFYNFFCLLATISHFPHQIGYDGMLC